MARLLLTVAGTKASGTGDIALIPGIDFRAGEEFRAGDPIRLKRPDGSVMRWSIGALTVVSRRPWRKDVCLVIKGLSGDDIPVGTKSGRYVASRPSRYQNQNHSLSELSFE